MFRKHLLQSCEKLCAATKRKGSGQMTDLSGDYHDDYYDEKRDGDRYE